jgi:hypothetical protein
VVAVPSVQEVDRVFQVKSREVGLHSSCEITAISIWDWCMVAYSALAYPLLFVDLQEGRASTVIY